MAVPPARRRAALAAVLLMIGALVACSGDDPDAGADAADTAGAADGDGGDGGDGGDEQAGGTDAEQAPPAPPEQFDGPVEDFYVLPDPLPAGGPGDLIRVQSLDTGPDEVGLRIMYHSTDADGEDRAATGTVFYPTAPAPEGGWPVLASAHGTTGIAPECAPSRLPLVPAAYGVTGVRVAPDYIGLGPEGEVHPYLSASAEGNAMVDAVRAAHTIAEAEAGDEWLVVGHSQGGHAALVTNEIGEERVPEYDLLGTVAIAPGAQFTETYGDDVQLRIITTMVLFGAAHEDPDIDPAEFLAPAAYAAAEGVVGDECLGTIIDTMLPHAASPDFYVQEPLDDEAARAWMEANDPGQVVSPAPLLLVSGGQDIIVVPARTHALFDRLCEMGQVVELVDLPDASHESEPIDGAPQITAWLADRLAGEPAPDSCA